MADSTQLIAQVGATRSTEAYSGAIRRLLQASSGAQDLAECAGNKNTDVYADLRVVIGAWVQISNMLKHCDDSQRGDVFCCSPVGLMWDILRPAVETIRANGAQHDRDDPSPEFAEEFRQLAEQYDVWAKSNPPFNTLAGQAICARFG